MISEFHAHFLAFLSICTQMFKKCFMFFSLCVITVDMICAHILSAHNFFYTQHSPHSQTRILIQSVFQVHKNTDLISLKSASQTQNLVSTDLIPDISAMRSQQFSWIRVGFNRFKCSFPRFLLSVGNHRACYSLCRSAGGASERWSACIRSSVLRIRSTTVGLIQHLLAALPALPHM